MMLFKQYDILLLFVVIFVFTVSVLSDYRIGHKHPNIGEIIDNNIDLRQASSFGLIYYVSTKGNDNTNNGSISSPFLTLKHARNTIRQLKKNNKFPIGGVLVYIREGIYMNNINNISNINEPILDLFGDLDSGLDNNSPIVYSGYPNENVQIIGGFKIDYKYFYRNGSYFIANLKNIFGSNIDKLDLGLIETQTLGLCNNYKSDLYLNYTRMTLARFPNKYDYYDEYTQQNIQLFNWTHIINAKKQGNTFTYDTNDINSERANEWLDAINEHKIDNNLPWLHGYMQVDWADNYVELEDINIHTNEITTNKNTPPVYTFSTGSRYYITNVLTELDKKKM
eukprot:497517_1